jgi:hypothetical protein
MNWIFFHKLYELKWTTKLKLLPHKHWSYFRHNRTRNNLAHHGLSSAFKNVIYMRRKPKRTRGLCNTHGSGPPKLDELLMLYLGWQLTYYPIWFLGPVSLVPSSPLQARTTRRDPFLPPECRLRFAVLSTSNNYELKWTTKFELLPHKHLSYF